MPGGFVGDTSPRKGAAFGAVAGCEALAFAGRSRGAGVPNKAVLRARTANMGAGVSGCSI